MKKHMKWLIPVVAILVIGIAAAAFFVVQQIGEKTPEVQEEEVIEIYWNLDAEKYRGEEAELRTPSEGMYRAAFAGGGKKVDLFFTDSAMMTLADSYDVMGLVVDENNHVTKVVDVYEFTGGVAAYKYYVDTFTEDTICTNSSLTFRAQNLTLKIDENTVIYDIGSIGPLAGQPAELTHGCEITALQNKRGIVTHIFMSPPFEKSPVYWNVKRMYNSTTKSSTREADLVGTYTIRFAVDGEVVELKCKSQKVVNTIDGYAGRCMHLEFDEEGYISAARAPSYATGNGSVASWFHIMEFTDNGFVAEKFSGSDKGSVKTINFSQDVKIFDVSTSGEDAGKPTTLRLHDQVHCLRDSAGDVCIVFVVSRFADAEIYWNLERLYDSTNKVTTRVPDGNGYYVYEMHHEGEYVTLRTKDKEVANVIDSRSAKCCALTVEGDIITYAANPTVAWRGKPVASSYVVSKITKDGTITAAKADGSASYTGTMAEECKVYNMTKYANKVGEETTVRVNDKIYALAGVDGLVYTVYVIGRSSDSPLYWNLDRAYDSTNKVTKRVPEEDGYYYFRMLKGTKIVTVRTKDKEMASKIDSWVACGFKLSGDKIVDAFKYTSVNNYDGGSFGSWYNVTEVTKTKLTAKRLLSGKDLGKVVTAQFASGYKIYDVSSYASTPGEETTLREGDRIQGFMNKQKKITAVYVVDRYEDVPMYWNVEKYDVKNGASLRKPAEDGYYYLTMATGGEQVVLKTKDASIVATIDGRAARCIGLKVEDGEIIKTYTPGKTVDSLGVSFASWYKVTGVTADGEVTAERVVSGVLDVQTAKMAADCGVYDVTDIGVPSGTVTQVQVGDTIHGIKNAKGEITTLYVVSKPMVSDIYWNITRQYDSTNKTTKRKPEADGYYYIDMAVGGERKTFKTDSVSLINKIDEVGTRCVGLLLDGDVITHVYTPVWEIEGYTGGTPCSWYDVMSIEGDVYHLQKNIVSDSDYGRQVTLTIPEECVVYNGSSNVISHVGEPTKLQVGDRIYCLENENDVPVYAIVVERPVGDVYLANCEVCQNDALWYEWDGVSTAVSGRHYYLAKDTTQTATGKIEEGRTVCLDLKGKTLTGTESILRIFNIYGTLNLFDSVGNGKVIASKPGASLAPVFAIQKDAVFNLYGGTLTSEYSTNRAGIGLVQEGTMNMYGGVMENGESTSVKTNETGGILEVLSNSTFYMYGGTIRGGKSASYGGNVAAFASAKVYLMGGTIENGTAALGGNDVHAKGNITVGGKMTVGELYMLEGKTIKISSDKPLDTDSRIGVAMDVPGVFTGVVDSAIAGCFYASGFGEVKQNADGKMTIVASAICEACNESVVWEAWDGKTVFEDGGHYYLTGDVSLTEICVIQEGESACLNLNGKTVNGPTAKNRCFHIKGEFNLMDTGETGKVIGRKPDAATAPAFCVYETGTFNLYGGTLTSTVSSGRAGVGLVQGGTMNMYGGILENGRCTSTDVKQGGGNLEVLPDGEFYMYGGVIRGGSSATYGGNISAYASAKLVLLGGTIENGTAGLVGDDVCAKGNVTVGGKLNVGEIYLFSGKKITNSAELPLTGGASVGVAMEAPGVFTDAIDATTASFFHPSRNDTMTQDEDGKLSLSHVHCICMGLDTEHTCNSAQVWEPWPADNAWESGKYYFLTSSVTEMPSIKIEEGQTLNLCLNGYDYTGKSSTYRLFAAYGNLNICDHKHGDVYEGTVTATYDAVGKMAPVFRVYSTATFNMYGGNYTATNEMLEAGLGVVDSGRMNIYDGKLYGGRVTTTKSTQGAGNLDIFGTGKVVMYDGIITDGQSALNGSNVYMNNANAVFEMRGGVISGGIAQNGAVSGKGTVILGGDARITGNTGGNIYLFSGASVTILDDFTGFAGVTLQNDTGAFGTSNIDITGLLVSDAGYVITQKNGVLTMEADN